jgi:DNA-binding PadR family transcriptional regulator
MVNLTKNEELIMLSIWHLQDGAYGVTIRKKFHEISKKTLNYGSLYNTLYLLVRKGLVATKNSDPLPERGGRTKILYSLTKEGKEGLKEAFQVQKAAWEGVTEYTFNKD